MNTIRNLLIAGAIALGALTASAQFNANAPYSVYSAGTTNGATALSWTIIGAHSYNNGTPLVTTVVANSDKAGSKVQFYRIVGQATVTFTNSTATVYVNNTNGIPTNAVVIIRHINGDGYEKRTCTSGNAGSTNIVLTAAPYATVPGDVVYGCTTTGAGSILLSTNTAANTSWLINAYNSQGIYAGQRGCPVLMEVDGTSSAALQIGTARFEP